jgi:hypothetical protein
MRQRVRANELVFLVGLFALAHAARLPGLPIAQVLGDSLGPWWVAYRGAFTTTPHAPPYGWGLAATYAPLLAVSGSLWTAITGLFALHAAASPIAYVAARRLGLRPFAAVGVGLVVAIDRGMIDTTISGAEGYLAATLLGLALAIPPRFGLSVGGVFALAGMHHPLAFCLFPLLLPRMGWSGSVLCGVLVAPQLWALGGAVQAEGSPAALDGFWGEPTWNAVSAWARQAGPGAIFFLAAGVGWVGSRGRDSREWAILLALSVLLLLGVGEILGYLRDHHLRFLTIPWLLGLGRLPKWLVVPLFIVGFRPPENPIFGPGAYERPGTLSLTLSLADTLSQEIPALDAVSPKGDPATRRTTTPLIDGLVVEGVLPAEPGGVVLELLLRGHRIGVPGADPGEAPPTLYLLVGEPRAGGLPDGPLRTLRARPGWSLRSGTLADAREFAAKLPGSPVPTGAFDGLILLDPSVPAARAAWWP